MKFFELPVFVNLREQQLISEADRQKIKVWLMKNLPKNLYLRSFTASVLHNSAFMFIVQLGNLSKIVFPMHTCSEKY
jgi:hypothetical protein